MCFLPHSLSVVVPVVNVQAVLQLTYLMSTGSTSVIVISSTIFSLVTLTMTVAGDDVAALKWSLTDKKKKEGAEEKEEEVTLWKRFITLYIWRIMDIVSKLAMYALFYSTEGGGIVTFIFFIMNVSIGGFVYLLIKNKLRIIFVSKPSFLMFT